MVFHLTQEDVKGQKLFWKANLENSVKYPMHIFNVLCRYQLSHRQKIHDFYEKLITHFQSLDIMGKLKETNWYIRMTLEKLLTIRGDLNWTNDDKNRTFGNF